MKPYLLVLASLVVALALLGGSQAQTMAGQLPSIPQAGKPESLVFTLEVPPLQITQGEAGFAQPQLEGYEATGAPGDPPLPARAYRIALPPDVILESVKANVIRAEIVEQADKYTLAPMPAGVTWVEEREVIQWGKNVDSIVDGKNTRVYQNDAYFPQSQLSSVRFDQMRKWRFVSLLVTPLQYNPITGKLRLVKQVQIEVSFERAASVDQRQLQLELSDTVMDDRAVEMFYNYEQARTWYPVMQRPEGLTDTYNYVIVTSNAILADSTASAALDRFVAHKQDQGYSVLVVTENQYGMLQSWNRAQGIRQWLHDNYLALSIHYVLLIGNPTPWNPASPFDPSGLVGDVPMRQCWPMHRILDKDGKLQGQNVPTDYLYANLEGNWDLNLHGVTDGYCGEFTDDDGDGGMSFQPNVYVGRIPVYRKVSDWAATLESILDKTIIYEDSSNTLWRYQALLPMSFSDSTTDGAYLAQAMKGHYLGAAGYSSYTLYQHDGPGCNSTFTSSQNLVDTAVREHWKNHEYGIVTWWAHGGQDGASIGYDSCGGGDVFTSGDASALNDSFPAIVFAISCQNGWPENPNNLGYALLKNGAVATFVSSRDSGYSYGNFTPSKSNGDNAHLGYYVMQRVVNEETLGHAFYDEKFAMSGVITWDGTSASNWINFNLYGDPSLSIKDGHSGAPSAPSNLTAASNATQGIDLTWTDNSDNEIGFQIQRTTDPGGVWAYADSVGINETFWSDKSASCGAHYYYRVLASNPYGLSGYSNQADAWSQKVDAYEADNTYENAAPIFTSGFYAGGQTHTIHIPGDVDWVKFHATWGKSYTIRTYNLGANSDTKLELYYVDGVTLLASNDDCTTGDPASCIENWAATSTLDYYVKISHAQNQGGCSGYGYSVEVQEGGVANWPAQPTALETTPVSHCQVNLNWIDNSLNETGFEIERWDWRKWLPTWHTIATVGPNITSYSDIGLDCYTPYPYRVRAYNANGKSLYSNESQAVTFTADTFETDNTYATASTIVVNGASQLHNFHTVGDEDWSKFSASAGQTYTITTSYLGSAADTVLELYNKNGTTQLEWNDDCEGRESCIRGWTAPSSGIYYVRVRNYIWKGGCPGYQYSLKVTTSPIIASLAPPSVAWPNTSVLGIQWTWVDPNIGIAHAFEVQRRMWITPTLGLWRQVGISGPGILTLARPSDGNFIFDDTNLTCNTTYEYRIRAFDELGASAYSEVISATTLLIDTFEPDDDYTQAQTIFVNSPYIQAHNLAPAMDDDWVSFTATAGEVYTVTTSQFTHSDSYTPTLALYGDPTAIPLASTQQCGADLRAFCLNGWTAPTSGAYYIRVSGQGGCPGHDYTLNVVDSHASASRPAAPTGLVATLTTSNQINLAWTDNTAYDHAGFRLDRLVGLGWMRVANLIGFTSYSDVGVSCGQSYTYRVYAYNAWGNSGYATLIISTPGCGYPVIYLPVLMIQ